MFFSIILMKVCLGYFVLKIYDFPRSEFLSFFEVNKCKKLYKVPQ